MIVGPSEVLVSYPGGPATFDCVSLVTATVDIHFLVNGSLLDGFTLKNVTQSRFRNNMGHSLAGILQFVDLPAEYNNTRIQCRAELSSGPPSTSAPAILLLQG